MNNTNNRLDQTEALLLACEADAKFLQTVHQQLPEIIQRNKDLNAYYQNDYLQDVDNYDSNGKHYQILNQDSIWNVLEEQHTETIKLLKLLVNSLER